MVMIPIHTRDTVGMGHGMSRVAKSPTHTHTCDTRDPKPTGFPVPVTNPMYLWWQKVSGQPVLTQNHFKSLQPSFKHQIDISLSKMRGIENYHIWKVFRYEVFCA